MKLFSTFKKIPKDIKDFIVSIVFTIASWITFAITARGTDYTTIVDKCLYSGVNSMYKLVAFLFICIAIVWTMITALRFAFLVKKKEITVQDLNKDMMFLYALVLFCSLSFVMTTQSSETRIIKSVPEKISYVQYEDIYGEKPEDFTIEQYKTGDDIISNYSVFQSSKDNEIQFKCVEITDAALRDKCYNEFVSEYENATKLNADELDKTKAEKGVCEQGEYSSDIVLVKGNRVIRIHYTINNKNEYNSIINLIANI